MLRKPNKSESLDQATNAVREAFRQSFPSPLIYPSSTDFWVAEVFDDHIVACGNGKYYSISYKVSGEDVMFAPASEWEEVEEQRQWVEAKNNTPKKNHRNIPSNALKTVALTDSELRVGNHIVLFGDKNHKDLDGEWFTPSTGLESSYTRSNMIIEDFEHGYSAEMDEGVAPDADDILGRVDWSTMKIDEYGVWVERVLDRRSKYVEYIQPLIEAGLVGTSSESIGEEVKILKTGEIVNWPLKRDTLTVMPAEPRMLLDNRIASAIKSLGIALPEQEVKPEAVSTTAGVAGSSGTAVTVLVGASDAAKAIAASIKATSKVKPAQEKQNMNKEQMKALKDFAELIGVEVSELSEEQQAHALAAAIKPETVDTAALIQETVEKTTKALMAAAPAINKDDKAVDVTVSLDEADRPFKSLAANMLAVKEYEVSKGQKVAPRLKFLKATGASEGIPSDGGLLVDPTLSGEILKPLHDDGPLSSMARRLPVGSNSNYGWLNGVDEQSRVDGSRWGGIRGYWIAEAATKTASKPTFRRINWELKELAVVVVATDQLLADAAMFSEVVRVGCSEELNFKVNAEMMNGNGVPGPLGIMNSGALITVTRDTGSKILGADISGMWNRMSPTSRKNAVWLIGNDSQPQLDNLFAVGSTAVLYPYASIGADGIQRLYNRPVVVTEFNQTLNTTGDIVLADMTQYLMWEKNGIEAATSIHVYFLSDEQAFRFVYRVDGKPAVDNVLTPYIGSTTTSPFVCLGSAT